MRVTQLGVDWDDDCEDGLEGIQNQPCWGWHRDIFGTWLYMVICFEKPSGCSTIAMENCLFIDDQHDDIPNE